MSRSLPDCKRYFGIIALILSFAKRYHYHGGDCFEKIKLLIITALCTVILCSCEPATEQEILQYAKNEFGKCELIETNVISEDEINYTFKDEQYGFVYHRYVYNRGRKYNISLL